MYRKSIPIKFKNALSGRFEQVFGSEICWKMQQNFTKSNTFIDNKNGCDVKLITAQPLRIYCQQRLFAGKSLVCFKTDFCKLLCLLEKFGSSVREHLVE